MAPWLLVLALFGVGANAQAYSSVFPYCPCQSDAKYGPYNWSLYSKKSVYGGTRYCYTLTTTQYTGAYHSCTNYDLKKIELDTKPECDSYIGDITFDGDYLSRSTQRWTYGTVSKITRGGGKDLGSFEELLGKEVLVCYTLSGSCNTEEKFCTSYPCKVAFFDSKNDCCPPPVTYYPPPPKAPKNPDYPNPPKPKAPKRPNAPKAPNAPNPPKPKAPKRPNAPKAPKAPNAPPPYIPPIGTSPFPYCPCLRTAKGPYSVTYYGSSKAYGLNRYCFSVTASKQGSYYCSSFDLRKIEFDVQNDCRNSVVDLTYNNDGLAASYTSWAGGSALIFKVSRPNSDKNPLSYEGDLYGKSALVCFSLRSGSCSTLTDFCKGGYCGIATFSPNNKCCPVNFLKY